MIHAHVQQEDMVHTDTFHLLPPVWTSLGTISYSDRHNKTILLEIIIKKKTFLIELQPMHARNRMHSIFKQGSKTCCSSLAGY